MGLVRQEERARMNNPVLLLATQIWTGFAGLAGIVIILGGAIRWSSNIYTYIALVPGSPHIWGIIMLTFVLASALAYHLGYPLVLRISLRCIATWCLLFAVGTVIAAFTIPTVSMGAAVWLTAAAVNYVLIAKCWKEYGDINAH